VRVPGQSGGTRGEVVRPGQVEERRQQGPLLGLAGRDELRYGKRADVHATAAARGPIEVEVGERAVGRAEIDADEVACHDRGSGASSWRQVCNLPMGRRRQVTNLPPRSVVPANSRACRRNEAVYHHDTSWQGRLQT